MITFRQEGMPAYNRLHKTGVKIFVAIGCKKFFAYCMTNKFNITINPNVQKQSIVRDSKQRALQG